MAKYKLHLKGYVGGPDFNTRAVNGCLSDNEDNDVNVLIDSTGGQLHTALSIASAFRRHGAVDVHFEGMNASAATVASLGARTISMDRNAMYLVHKCSNLVFAWDSMNADELADYIEQLVKTKADLDKIDDNIAAMYASRCRKDKQALIDLMKEGAWLNAKEALDWGFIDKITDAADSEPVQITASLASDFESAGIPLPGPVVKTPSAISSILAAISDFFSSKKKENQPEEPATQPEDQVVEDTVEQTAEETVEAVEATEATAEETEPVPEAEEPVTSQVIDDSSTKTEANILADYIETAISARKLFNSLP